MIRHFLCAGLLATGFGFGASTSNAAVVLWDDDASGGSVFSRSWYTGIQNAKFYTGPQAAYSPPPNAGNSQIGFEKGTGLTVGENRILEMWINTSDESAATGLYLEVSYDGKTVPFDNRNVPTKYKLDGQEYTWASGTGISTDANSNTWQKLEIDLFQKTYTGFPFVEHQMTSTSLLTKINFRNDQQLLVDSVTLNAVPEPGAIAVLGLAAFVAIRRRRRA